MEALGGSQTCHHNSPGVGPGTLCVPSPALVSPQQDKEWQAPRTLQPRETLGFGL